ncbi:hypothetical protein KIW84_054301 [Lathyrus oleraceus]|uniref:Uncharacterized protein n=1 Tax=Pisum sativum TaxID=3888 RepID=A0A9D4WV09_PEA|nr:hypothetical protein KIW84_054301 [Pisum sativum]
MNIKELREGAGYINKSLNSGFSIALSCSTFWSVTQDVPRKRLYDAVAARVGDQLHELKAQVDSIAIETDVVKRPLLAQHGNGHLESCSRLIGNYLQKQHGQVLLTTSCFTYWPTIF